ncbi:MAG: 4Fe-4S binding protein, partial [Erysipelotrichaceae bacterium]|nr:4Fe-4S binding protein [Erysipelotrichaceae bacterium]
KCSPCRIGTKRMLEVLTKITEGRGTRQDLEDLRELANNVKTNSLCGLGQTAPNPILSTMASFMDEYIAHIDEKRCPAHVCKKLMSYVIDKDKCFGCKMCQKGCPADAIHQIEPEYIAPGKKLPALCIDPNTCIKCGACIATCKFGAISKQ